MKRRLGSSTAALALVAAGVASVSVATIGISLADASAASHTLRFTSVETSQKEFKANHFVSADKDESKGKVIGYDVLDGVYNAKAAAFVVDLAASLNGGIIYVHGRGSGSTGKFTGSVEGGTGKFTGVSGTVTGQSIGKNGDNEKLVITYHH